MILVFACCLAFGQMFVSYFWSGFINSETSFILHLIIILIFLIRFNTHSCDGDSLENTDNYLGGMMIAIRHRNGQNTIVLLINVLNYRGYAFLNSKSK